MAKKIEDFFYDDFLAALATCTTMHVTSAEPTNHADITNVTLADVILTAGVGGGDYTVANGDTSGRKLTVAQQTDIPIDNSGTATHVALTDGTNIWVTTCTSQVLTAGGTVTVPAFDAEIADPV